ncbi:MAG TPA: hypothetical protein VFX96_14120 [Pyrinomonadaceae bacterium]|nr:hypothetical protein [Pyrinomonadaceae bacterium]
MKKSHALVLICLLILCTHAALTASARQQMSPRKTETIVADPTVFAPKKRAKPSRAAGRGVDARRADPASSDATTDELVDRIFTKYVEAQGGYAALAAVKTRIMRGMATISLSNVPGTVEYYSKAPDKSLTVIYVPSGAQLIQAYDGRSDWMSNPLTGSVVLEGGSEVVLDRGTEFGRIRKAREMYTSVAYKGKARLGAREAHVIVAARAGRDSQTLYFDTASGLLLRAMAGLREPETKMVTPVTINFDHHAKVDGVLLPTSVEYVFPTHTITFKIYEVKHNVHIDDSMFQLPAPRAGN